MRNSVDWRWLNARGLLEGVGILELLLGYGQLGHHMGIHSRPVMKSILLLRIQVAVVVVRAMMQRMNRCLLRLLRKAPLPRGWSDSGSWIGRG